MTAHLRIDLIFKSGTKAQVKVPLRETVDHSNTAFELAESLSKTTVVWLETVDGFGVFIRTEDLSMAMVIPVL